MMISSGHRITEWPGLQRTTVLIQFQPPAVCRRQCSPTEHRVIESYHRITEWPGLKRTTVLIQFQPPAMCRVASLQTMLPRATSSVALNASRDGASTTSSGNLFQCFTTLCMKNFLLTSNLNLPCLSLRPFPLVQSLSIHVKSCFLCCHLL